MAISMEGGNFHTNFSRFAKYVSSRVREPILKELRLPKMTYKSFLETHYPESKRDQQRERFPQIENLFGFWDEGYTMMSEAKDPLHSHKHVDRMFSFLHYFMTEFPFYFKNVNLEVVTTSIIYHDLWRGMYDTKGVGAMEMVRQHLTEGREASKLFTQLAKNRGFDQGFVDAVATSIYEHSDFKFKHSSKESMILNDIDYIEMWSPERIKDFLEVFRTNPNLDIKKGWQSLVKRAQQFAYKNHRYYLDVVEDAAQVLSVVSIQTLEEELKKLL